ncbi:MAG TPA: DNA alkylation repair protein [Chitinispirillaceae bacterium]|nr:DNA alkylation repair protein [Chitinispirillaceae bacterium]
MKFCQMKEKLIDELRLVLQNNADNQTRISSCRFFKKGEEALVYGVKMAEVTKIAKEFLKQIKRYSKQDVFVICEELWKSGYLEEAIISCKITESLNKQYEPVDFRIFERWVNKYVNNWADCDTLCNHTIGTFIMMYPEYLNELKKWAKSPDRWTKRASAVTLIIPARKGLFLKDIFEIADILLLDKDDMVQKGYGWMLKAASESNQKAVFDYVVSKKEVMPRTALRYSIEKMPKDLKVEAMRK